jgi:hypothetical protein
MVRGVAVGVTPDLNCRLFQPWGCPVETGVSMSAILIENKEMADSYRKSFHLAWKTGRNQ